MSLLNLFDDRGVATFTSPLAAAEVESQLRDNNLSFRTRIIKTRKRGLEYRIDLLNGP
jgi:hypothetical protein